MTLTVSDQQSNQKSQQLSTPWSERYRPTSLSEVVGQSKVVEKLKEVVRDYRTGKADMPHLMFKGPPGVGKTSTALALCQELFGPAWRSFVLDTNASSDRGIAVVR